MAKILAEKTGAKPTSIVSLARWIRGFDKTAIPAAALRQAKLLVLDTIGCGLAGREEHVSSAVLGVMDIAGAGQCSIIGTGWKTTPTNAVLANGVLIRVLDLNDYVIGGLSGGMQIGGHPSDNIPVALAFGEMLDRSGRDVLNSIVIGYEVYGRMREMMGRDGCWDGVTISGLAAPAIAGFLMGLDEERLAHAIALGAARAPTSAAVRTGDISGAKSVANALVAQSGVLAARLAEHGVTGPLSVLDQTRGLQDVFTQPETLAGLTLPLAERCYIMMAHMKAYPCVATGQAAVAAALQLHKEVRDDLDSAQRIDVIMADYPFLRRQQQDLHRRHPDSREAADHSFNFVIAAALLDGEFGLAQFDGERWTDPKVKALMEKMVMIADTSWNERAPGGYPCTIRVIGKDGRETTAEVAYPPGFSRGGIDENAVIDKFHRSAAAALGKEAREKVIAAVMDLDRDGNLASVFAAIK
jgi:2-methylcitrate dehydratase